MEVFPQLIYIQAVILPSLSASPIFDELVPVGQGIDHQTIGPVTIPFLIKSIDLQCTIVVDRPVPSQLHHVGDLILLPDGDEEFKHLIFCTSCLISFLGFFNVFSPLQELFDTVLNPLPQQ